MTSTRAAMASIAVLVPLAAVVITVWPADEAPRPASTQDDLPAEEHPALPGDVTLARAPISSPPMASMAAAGSVSEATSALDSTLPGSGAAADPASAEAGTGASSLFIRTTSCSGIPLAGIRVTLAQAGPGDGGGDLALRLLKHVRSQPTGGGFLEGVRLVTICTGPDGRAAVHGLAEWRTPVKCDRAEGFEPPEPMVIVPSGQEIVLKLCPTGWVSGVVVDPAGAPVQGVHVGRIDPPKGQGCAADAAGRFAIEAPLGEAVDLGVLGEELAEPRDGEASRSYSSRMHHRGWLRGVRAPAADLVLRVAPIASDRSMQVSVRDADGLPAPRVEVYLRLPRFDVASATTDAEGRSSFAGLPDEELVILAWPTVRDGPWVAPRPIRAIPNGQSIELRLRRSASIAGIVLDADGAPVWGDIVKASAPEEPAAATVTDASGRFRLTVALDARYDLCVEHISDRGLNTVLHDVAADGGETIVRLGTR